MFLNLIPLVYIIYLVLLDVKMGETRDYFEGNIIFLKQVFLFVFPSNFFCVYPACFAVELIKHISC